MKLYHRTPYGARILRYGFKQTRQTSRQGIWFSNVPLDTHGDSGAKGMTVLCVMAPVAAIREYEVFERFEDGQPYREWLIPAEVAKRFGPPTVHDHDLKGWTREGRRRWISSRKLLQYDASEMIREFRREWAFAKRLGLLKD